MKLQEREKPEFSREENAVAGMVGNTDPSGTVRIRDNPVR
jgi:hypothetical protein